MERLRQMEGLIGRIESTASPDLRAQVRELVEAILEFHGIGLSRMLELMGETDPALREFSRDPEVSSLLLLHGLHPEGLEIRVKRAVDHMPDVEFIQIFEGRLRLKARSGSVARQAVEEAIYAAAPEIEAIDIEGLEGKPSAFVPLESLLSR
jgi:hypothetical protein